MIKQYLVFRYKEFKKAKSMTSKQYNVQTSNVMAAMLTYKIDVYSHNFSKIWPRKLILMSTLKFLGMRN